MGLSIYIFLWKERQEKSKNNVNEPSPSPRRTPDSSRQLTSLPVSLLDYYYYLLFFYFILSNISFTFCHISGTTRGESE